MKRARLLILASTMAMVGWGRCCRTSTPTPRTPAAGAASSPPRRRACSRSVPWSPRPLGGRLADRFAPVRVAVGAKLVAAAGTGYLVLAGSPAAFLAGMFVFGVGITAAAPAQSVLVLRWVASEDRRRVVRVAVHRPGARHGPRARSPPGYMVDLARAGRDVAGLHHRGRGLRRSPAVLLLARRRAARPTCDAPALGRRRAGPHRQRRGDPADLRHARRCAGPRVVTIALALGFYAQFECGLPGLRPDRARRRRAHHRHRRRRQLRGHHRPADGGRAVDGAPLGAVAAGRGRRHLGAVLADPRHGVTPAGAWPARCSSRRSASSPSARRCTPRCSTRSPRAWPRAAWSAPPSGCSARSRPAGRRSARCWPASPSDAGHGTVFIVAHVADQPGRRPRRVAAAVAVTGTPAGSAPATVTDDLAPAAGGTRDGALDEVLVGGTAAA